jgi:uncharacterized membrane protein YfcA
MIAQIVSGVAIVAGAAWGAAALWFQSPFPGRARAVLPAAWLALAAGALIGLSIGQPLIAWLFGALLLALLAWWWLGVRPSNERQWMPEVARQTQATCATSTGGRAPITTYAGRPTATTCHAWNR